MSHAVVILFRGAEIARAEYSSAECIATGQRNDSWEGAGNRSPRFRSCEREDSHRDPIDQRYQPGSSH